MLANRARTLAVLLLVTFALRPSVGAAQTQDALFDDSTLQELRLSLNSQDWQTLKARYDENTYYPADLTWHGLKVRNIGIRSRGSGTRNATKPGLRFDFNRYVSNQEFLGLKALDVKNMYSDPSLLRESLAMKFYARLGLAAAREAHTLLYVNDEYLGVYVLVESVDRTFVSRHFGAREAEIENGGYLFEYKWLSVYGFEYLGPDLRSYAPSFEPKTRETDAVVALYGPIEEMIRAINETSDEEFESVIGGYIDLPALLKYTAAEIFTVEWDGFAGNWGTNNFYLYRFHQDGRSQLIPWDRDHAFIWDDVHRADFIAADITLRLDTNALTRRALAVPHLRQMYFDALMECVRIADEHEVGDRRGWLEREAGRQANQIAAALATDPNFPFLFDQFQGEVDFLMQFARERAGLVACDIAAMEASGEPRRCTPPEPLR